MRCMNGLAYCLDTVDEAVEVEKRSGRRSKRLCECASECICWREELESPHSLEAWVSFEGHRPS